MTRKICKSINFIKIGLTAIMLLTTLSAIVTIYAQELKPIKGALVIAVGNAGYGETKTDINGFFEITEGLGEGMYDVKVTAKGYITRIIKNVRVKADSATDLGDIELDPSAIIKGVVESPDGKPAGSVTVTLKTPDGKVVSVTTAADDGSFTFDTDVVTGTYSIEAYAFSFEGLTLQMMKLGMVQVPVPVLKGGASYLEGYTSGLAHNIKAVQGEVTSGVVVKLGVSGIISGRVTDKQGNPVARVLVIAYPSEWTTGETFRGFFDWTDENGNYRIANNLPTGDYNVTILFPRNYVWKFTDAKTVHVEAGKETSNVNFQLEKSGIISGTVVYTDGTPAANATVIAFSEEGEYLGFASTEIDGSFRIDTGLGTGTYQVTAFSGYMMFSEPKTVQVKAGEETKGVKLILRGTARAMATIEGIVTDENGNPIAEAEVHSTGKTTYTRADGTYRLTVALPLGKKTAEVKVTAYKRGYNRTSKSVTLEAGKVKTGVDFTLKSIRLGVIRGRVVTRSPAPSPKKIVELSVDISTTKIAVGDSVTISGTTTPAVTGKVLIYVASDEVFEKADEADITNGAFSYVLKPDKIGVYRIKVVCPGNEEYASAESEIITLTVVKVSPSVEISVSKTKTNVGETVTISGSITPFKAETKVIIVVTTPATVKEYEVTSSDGKFKYNLKLDTKGIWSVKAKIPESEIYTSAESGEVKITVEEKKCIIATVTFGSELSPEVNFLRSFRDNLILKTHSGRQFYIAFDAFYYSWSTPVANLIASNQVLKTLVKLLIYPLLGILKLTAMVTTGLFQFNSEAAAILAGFIASSLIGVVYILPILLVLSLIVRRVGRKPNLSIRWIKTSWIVVLISIVFIVLGLMIGSDPLLTVSTSVYVLANIASATISTFSLLARRL